jgi:hypothetical protein
MSRELRVTVAIMIIALAVFSPAIFAAPGPANLCPRRRNLPRRSQPADQRERRYRQPQHPRSHRPATTTARPTPTRTRRRTIRCGSRRLIRLLRRSRSRTSAQKRSVSVAGTCAQSLATSSIQSAAGLPQAQRRRLQGQRAVSGTAIPILARSTIRMASL